MAATSSPRELRSDAARNHQVLVRAATAAVHREGPRVPMATIAADAGVGVGTLYRHFPTREDLLNHLTHASFEQVLANARAAEGNGTTATEALQQFIEAAISQDVTPGDVVVFGAMLAQPRQADPEWDTTCRRLLGTYLNGLRAC